MSKAREPAYAELHALSNFSFLRGASQPEELVVRAHRLGYAALALTDECSVAGVVRAHSAARDTGVRLVIGTELVLEDGLSLVLLATDRAGYGSLCELITRGRRAAPKGRYRVCREDLASGVPGCLVLAPTGTGADAGWVASVFPGRAWIALELWRDGRDRKRLEDASREARRTGLPLVAAGGVLMHGRSRRALQDTLTAIRLGTTVQAAGFSLLGNAERHLRSRVDLRRLYPPELLAETVQVAQRCHFSLDELRYEYPDELAPAGYTPASWLRALTAQGVRRRWPDGAPERVREQIDQELYLIDELGYQPYFLTVYDIVRFARSRGILCQGRGSAANSAVCYCLGITEVDPARMEMLFERFISRERNEPPDIDVDFEHERREEVIQYLYSKYGRERAALAATVITYRPKSALRDVGKALGLDAGQVERLTRAATGWRGAEVSGQCLQEAGFDPASPLMRRVLTLTNTLLGFPRHLSQHVGGFVIARDALTRLVPVENAAMPERTVIQWDKDDLDALGLLKVDCLGLGMLSAIRRAFGLIHGYRGQRLEMATVPSEDPSVYAMLQRADTVGVFQVESRAQMSMLPRLRPERFYDLVIEVAIVRPGPIQGGMVHPYLRRRQGLEPVTYPSEGVRGVLERTLGVPIFQEQVIKLAMVAAGFMPGEADQLRRSMAAWRRRGGLQHFEQRLLEGMTTRGYSEEFARRIFEQIQGFGEYGFPESHAASFALLVYVSAWLKCHEPAAFTCALLNSQPMGFYAPAQLVQDLRRHDVQVRPVDVRLSDWDCSLEPALATQHSRPNGQPALRLGLRMAKGLSRAGGERIVSGRACAFFTDVDDLARRCSLDRRDMAILATSGALAGLAGDRHQARWAVAGVESALPLFPEIGIREPVPELPPPTEGGEIVADYQSLGLTLRRHPLSLLRARLSVQGVRSAAEVFQSAHGRRLRAGGLVIARQRPASASGTTFVTLEDETGSVNVIVWARVGEQQRRVLLGARLMVVNGEVQREGEVLHLIARGLEDHSDLMGALLTRSRDFH
jgi:error-prone DNA polymerase